MDRVQVGSALQVQESLVGPSAINSASRRPFLATMTDPSGPRNPESPKRQFDKTLRPLNQGRASAGCGGYIRKSQLGGPHRVESSAESPLIGTE